MLRPTLRLQPHSNVGDTVIEAGEASEKVDGEGAGGTLDIHRQLMGARCGLNPDDLYLLQQVPHCQDFILLAAHGPRANAGDLLQVPSRLWGDGKETIVMPLKLWRGNKPSLFAPTQHHSVFCWFPAVHTHKIVHVCLWEKPNITDATCLRVDTS